MYLVFDIGGTHSRAGVSTDRKIIDNFMVWDTPANFEVPTQIAKDTHIEKVGVAIAGVLDHQKEMLINSPNLQDWVGKPIKEEFEKFFKAPVTLANDATAEGIGEALLGAGSGHKIVAYVCVGTGIGGAKIVNGKPEATHWGFEPGQQIIGFEEKIGYWEEMKPNLITDEQGWDKEAQLLAVGIQNLIVMWSPEIVILGGGLGRKVPLDKLKDYVAKLLHRFPDAPNIVLGELGEKAGLYGMLTVLSDSTGNRTPIAGMKALRPSR